MADFLNCIATASAAFSIGTALTSAFFWWKSSRVRLPSEEEIPDQLPGQGLVSIHGEDQAQWMERGRAGWRRIDAAMDALKRSSQLNAIGALWAMATAILLAVNLGASWLATALAAPAISS